MNSILSFRESTNKEISSQRENSQEIQTSKRKCSPNHRYAVPKEKELDIPTFRSMCK